MHTCLMFSTTAMVERNYVVNEPLAVQTVYSYCLVYAAMHISIVVYIVVEIQCPFPCCRNLFATVSLSRLACLFALHFDINSLVLRRSN